MWLAAIRFFLMFCGRLGIAVPDGDFEGEIVEADAAMDAVAGFAGGPDGGDFGGAEGSSIGEEDGEGDEEKADT
jgi:hypothetical protein